jgi:hypothetical protein
MEYVPVRRRELEVDRDCEHDTLVGAWAKARRASLLKVSPCENRLVTDGLAVGITYLEPPRELHICTIPRDLQSEGDGKRNRCTAREFRKPQMRPTPT